MVFGSMCEVEGLRGEVEVASGKVAEPCGG